MRGAFLPGLALLTLLGLGPRSAIAASCESMLLLKLPHTTITMAETVDAGSFSVPAGSANDAFDALPAFCRVSVTLKPTDDSDIKVEVWMPMSGWNGKFQGVGNGGWAGSISYTAMAEALARGYATSSTDTGHSTRGGSFALGHPDKYIDFAYRGIHEMTVTAKVVVDAFYGEGPQYSYFNGCSGGGRQAFHETKRFPEDYDGIIAGAAASPRTRLSSWNIAVGRAALMDPDGYIPPDKYPMIHEAVVNACDAIDGLQDGLIDDPRMCHFNPDVIACEGGADGAACLTLPQVETARTLMNLDIQGTEGERLFPGYAMGSELGWGVLARGPEPFSTAGDQFRYVVYEDPDWNWRAFDIARDPIHAEEVDNETLNVINPGFRNFADRGGKLLVYHGWSDPNVPPGASIMYYDSVVEEMGSAEAISDSLRLFMAPGMGHCRGGEGPNSFDTVTALERWVEDGIAPDRIIASHRTADGVVDRTRPLCPYPQVARYTGTGNIDRAVNFTCNFPE